MGELLVGSLELWSFVAGVFLCIVYDCFRLFRLRKPSHPIGLFFADFTFCIISALTMAVLFFNLSYGRVRVYALLFLVPGFLLWRYTVSRLVMSVVTGLLNRITEIRKSMQKRLKSLRRRIYIKSRTKRYCRVLVRRAKHGFGIINRKEM